MNEHRLVIFINTSLNFFLASNFFSWKSVGKHCLKSPKYNQNAVYHECF